MIADSLIAVAIVFGSALALIGSIGLVRLHDLYSRLHGPTKATTLGTGSLLIASALHFSRNGHLSLHEILVTAFLFLTAPVSAHMMAKAALHLRLPSVTRPPVPADRDAFPETVPTATPEGSAGG